MAVLDTLFDNFDDNSLNASKWIKYGGNQVQETGGELRITTTKGIAYYGIYSTTTYDLTNSYARILVVSAGAISTMSSLEVELKIIKDNGTNEAYITISGYDRTITSAKVVSGVTTYINETPYNPNVHRYLRIRSASGTMYWEYSTDGATFTTLASQANPFAITAITPVIQAGTFAEELSTTTVRFDDFNIIPTETSSNNAPASNPINIKALERKEYLYKVYNSSGTYLGEWKDVANDLTYSQEINSAGPSTIVQLARPADQLVESFNSRVTVSGDTRITVNSNTRVSLSTSTNAIGSGTDVDLRNKVEIYVFYGGTSGRSTVSGDVRVTVNGNTRVSDVGAPNGTKKFIGYIVNYAANYGTSDDVRVMLYSYGAEFNNYLLNNAGTITLTYNSYDPSDILRDVLDKFTADGGIVDYDSQSISDTNTSVSYTFRSNTVLEAIEKILELAPTDWYWYVDVATNTLHFKEKSSTANHTFVLGKHIQNLDIEYTIEEMSNKVLFVGGDTGGGSNLLKQFSDSTSITSYGQGLEIYSDNRVTDSTSATIIGQSIVARKKDPRYRTQVDILSEAYDIESIYVGQTVQFRGFNNYIDDVLLQIVGLRYHPDSVTLQLDSLLPSVSKRVEDVKRNLRLQENEANPSAPS